MKTLVVPLIIAVAVDPLYAQEDGEGGSSLNLTIGNSGIAFGHAERINGIRINWKDRSLDYVNGMNLTFWIPDGKPYLGTVNGLAIGLTAPAGERLHGVSITPGAFLAEEHMIGLNAGLLALVLSEQDREISRILLLAERILIENGDAVISTCIPFDRPREVVATVCHPAFAFKQAQHLWTVCAELQRWDWLQRTQFILSTGLSPAMPVNASHDLAYVWLPYEEFDRASLLAARLRMLAQRIKAGGHAFLVGPALLGDELAKAGFHPCWEEAVERLPTLAMHRTILPKAKLRSGLTMFHVRRS